MPFEKRSSDLACQIRSCFVLYAAPGDDNEEMDALGRRGGPARNGVVVLAGGGATSPPTCRGERHDHIRTVPRLPRARPAAAPGTARTSAGRTRHLRRGEGE